MLVTGLLYVAALAITVCSYVFYTHSDGCKLNKVFISINLLLSITVSVMTLIPKIQDAQPSAGLLQGAVISAYTMYLTWSAMSNEPDAKCNPAGKLFADGNNLSPSFDVNTTISVVLLFCTVVWSCIRTTSNSNLSMSYSETDDRVEFVGQEVCWMSYFNNPRTQEAQ